MTIGKLLDIPNTFTLLIAPPAWGKTTRLVDWFYKADCSTLIYISPLRALADEVEEHFKDFNVINVKNAQDFTLEEQKKVYVLTPERLPDDVLSLIDVQKTTIFIDEFHLFFYWQNFRSQMWECIENISTLEVPVMAVTATFSDDLYRQWKRYVFLNFTNFVVIDLGNFKLKKYPQKIHYLSISPLILLHCLILQNRVLKQSKVVLCFCQYRYEVKKMVNYFSKIGVSSIGKVGGDQVNLSSLLTERKCELICATMTLSHGVNIDNITDIVFLYQESNRAFFLQMTARGGRRGDEYCLWLPTIKSYLVLDKVKALIFYIHYVVLVLLIVAIKIRWIVSKLYGNRRSNFKKTGC